MASPKYISMGFLVLIIFLRLSSAHRVLADSVDQIPKQSHLSTQPIFTSDRGSFGSGSGGAYGGGIIGRGHDCTGGGCSGSGYPGSGTPIYGQPYFGLSNPGFGPKNPSFGCGGMPIYEPPYFGPSNPGFGPRNPGWGCGCPCSCTGTGGSGGHLNGDGSSTRAHNEPMSSEAVKADQEAHKAHNHGPFEFSKRANEPDPQPMDSIVT
ncbi:hypothetical protein Acr_19g0004510 [Actinidia rufa]|uniref:Glycine-rich protein n=1 Tax=Actinidia rufa TaxID=165716 RepID=A0A7J0G9P0_9ERIC|nr:hypothetical protein Acr_19g0004510 [Actinidia rufa]